MFSVPTYISPLPPTPLASPSHEPSQDAICDSLPPMEQSTVSESPLKGPMKPYRVPESPLKDPVDSKPQNITKSPDPPVKKAHVKKVDSVIHRSPRSRERRNEERRPRDPRMYRRSVWKAGFQTQSVSETPLCTAINAHFPGKCPSLLPQPRQLVPKKTLVDNLKRAIMEAKHVNEFRPDDVLWEKICKGRLKNPVRSLKNTDKRMVYIYNNMFFVKKDYFLIPNGKAWPDSTYSND
ncbi:hypothetical protein TNCV_1347821 [Trichonephila clavipes]|nr:hypothetical protein TNCV_1347821 [Trichonephila clavipes]